MKSVFADTLYWVAIVRPDDPWAAGARRARQELGEVLLVTTDEVLTEFLAALSRGGPTVRKQAVEMVHAILTNPDVEVIAQTRDGFLAGVQRYRQREDKNYSLTDCIAMNVMEGRQIHEVLTNDHHFEQEGFVVLIKSKG